MCREDRCGEDEGIEIEKELHGVTEGVIPLRLSLEEEEEKYQKKGSL